MNGVASRLVIVAKDQSSSPADPRFDIWDTGRFGETVGFAPAWRAHDLEGLKQWLTSERVPEGEIQKLLADLERTGKGDVQLPPRVGPRIVRSWFDTVINPLIGSLELEVTLVARRNWTWSFQPASFERIGPVRRYLDQRAWVNLEQFLDLYPNAAQATLAHDEAADQLLERATALQEALSGCSQFIQLCDSVFAVTDVAGAYPAGEPYALMAQYVVNTSGELPSYYSTAQLWNKHRRTFLELLVLPGIRERHAELLETGTALAGATEHLARILKDLRLKLSLAYDVPPYIGNNEAA